MADVLADGPTGEWVRVAVVDTGLETCHPDLKSNVEAGASFNFNAEESIYAQYLPRTFRNEALDPFNFDSTGDHGTSVSGLVAAEGNNGIGIRGVAPDVALRGYNFLNAVDQLTALIGSLGASSFFPIPSSSLLSTRTAANRVIRAPGRTCGSVPRAGNTAGASLRWLQSIRWDGSAAFRRS